MTDESDVYACEDSSHSIILYECCWTRRESTVAWEKNGAF